LLEGGNIDEKGSLKWWYSDAKDWKPPAEINDVFVNKKRTMTDKLWVFVFLAYLILMSVFSFIGYKDGNLQNLIAPIDENK
jgi:hypothetical protein